MLPLHPIVHPITITTQQQKAFLEMSATTMGAPVIDISNFESRHDEIQQQLMEAAEGVGFFQIVGHGIPKELIDAQFEASERFFSLPDDIKAKYPFASWNGGWEKMKQVRWVSSSSSSSKRRKRSCN